MKSKVVLIYVLYNNYFPLYILFISKMIIKSYTIYKIATLYSYLGPNTTQINIKFGSHQLEITKISVEDSILYYVHTKCSNNKWMNIIVVLSNVCFFKNSTSTLIV